jgi:mannan endo-1,4-beta-mannosidase
VVSTTPANNATDVAIGDVSIQITYDKDVRLDKSKTPIISGANLKGDASVNGKVLTVPVNCSDYETKVTLTIPEGMIYITGAKAAAYTLSFTTAKKPESPSANISASPVVATMGTAKKLYTFLRDNYQKSIITGMMADVAWNNSESEKVYNMIGKYPAINGYDYIHLAYSLAGANWINYGDITPVKTWWDNGGIPTIGWHWNVPSTEGGKDLGFYKKGSNGGNGETTFSIANAVTEGTWENKVIAQDLESIAKYIKLLKDANIPVLWRPLHEASGGWFWWGAGTAEQYKKLWITMFDYFKAQELTNLIWVWTYESNETWYPGDNYVDIIGCDTYGDNAASCAKKYNDILNAHTNKMIALTECGYSSWSKSNIAYIPDQWDAGAKWSWFMPWYSTDTHAPKAWWEKAKSASNVIWRDQVPSLK